MSEPNFQTDLERVLYEALRAVDESRATRLLINVRKQVVAALALARGEQS